MAALSTSEEGNAIHFEDGADPPVAKDERPPGAIQFDREAPLEIAHQRLGIRSPTIRFTDPVPMSSLRHLPFPVAVEIQSIGRRQDRRQDKGSTATTSHTWHIPFNAVFTAELAVLFRLAFDFFRCSSRLQSAVLKLFRRPFFR